MELTKVSFSGKGVLKKVLLVFLGSLILGLFAGFYALGLIQGFALGHKETQSTAVSFLEITPTETPTPTLTPTPSFKPKPTATPIKLASWGGPELWEAVNKRRQDFGVNPLASRSELCTIASIRLNELLALGKLDNHEGFSNMAERRPDLKWIFDKYSNVAEFLAMGGRTAQETVSLWENTLGHRKLLDGGEYVWGCIYAQNTFAVAITAF